MKAQSSIQASLRFLAILLGLLLPCDGFSNSQSGSSSSDSFSPAAKQFRALEQEYRTEMGEYSKRLTTSKTEEDRQIVYKSYPQPQKYTGRFLELAEKNPDDPIAVDALVWVVQYGRVGPEPDRALKTLLEEHMTSEKLGLVCQALVYSPVPTAERNLRDILAKSPHREVQGEACFSLAQFLKRRSSSESEKFLKLVVEKYADVRSNRGKTLGELVEADFFEARELAVGKAAPEIEGEDIDARRFTLSDYRGKVVVIDFWGDW